MDGRLLRGDRTRVAVLDRAMAMATEAGLDGLSLGQLAEALGVSKSGLFAHWKSKEELQLATIEHARQIWVERVIAPALTAPRGVRRLWALHQSRMDYYAASILPGGCFFANTQFEFNARPGAVRDRLAMGFTDWMGMLSRLVTEAIEAGELPADVDPDQLAYEIEALGLTAVMQVRLLKDSGYSYARQAVLDRLRFLCPDPTLLPEEP
jgi:AcrR family transcriptional regulator